jgi:hypothetical protein
VKDANDFLATLEKLIKSPDAYKLSDTQYDDLTRLRDDAMGLFNNGDLDGAHAVIKEMQEIVEEGAPLTE